MMNFLIDCYKKKLHQKLDTTYLSEEGAAIELYRFIQSLDKHLNVLDYDAKELFANCRAEFNSPYQKKKVVN